MIVTVPLRVLIVDDEPGIQRIFKHALLNYGFAVETAGEVGEALAWLDAARFDVVVSDIHMPAKNGIEFLAAAHAKYPALPIIVMTGRPSDDLLRDASAHGAYRYLVKPVMPSALRTVIESAVGKRQASV